MRARNWRRGMIVLLVVATGLVATFGILGVVATRAEEDHAAAHRAFLDQARGRQLPSVAPGQVVHILARQYERRAPASGVGPANLDPAHLAPATTLTESWAVADAGGRMARVATYVRDERGDLLGQSLVDEHAQMTVHEPRRGTVKTASFPERAAIGEAGGRADSAGRAPNAASARPIRQGQEGDRAVTILEEHGPADPGWLRLIATGELQQPYAGDLNIKEHGRRRVFDRGSSALLREIEFVVTEGGAEVPLSTQEWERVEVLDAGQVPVGALTPAMPTPPVGLAPVALLRLPVGEAAKITPFTLHTLAPSPSGVEPAAASYTAGQRVAPGALPIQFRGLDFAVQRGDAARIVYDQSGRYLDLVQGSSGDFGASLRQTPAFCASARPVTVPLVGGAVPGWSLEGAPARTTADPTSGVYRTEPGQRWILLPDVGGTAILLTSQGYGEAELLAIAARLQPAR